jgi:DNA-binding IclR family transcriptional regulator
MLARIHPLLEELSRDVDETVDLSVLERGRATFIDQVVAPHRLRAVSAVGESFPLHCTANGKAFLAGMSPEELSRFLSVPLARLTPRTITDSAELQRGLRQVHAEGIAFDREEHTEGICAVGARLRGLMGVPVAVSIPMPAQRFYGREDFLRDSLLAWTERIEREVGDAGVDVGGSARARLRADRRKDL